MTGDLASPGPRNLYYEEKGSGGSILLIHPAGATGSTWGQVVEELARAGRVIAYDRRGYRRSGGGDPVRSVAEHTADAAALVEALQAAPVVAVGTSVGATIAIDLARLRPDLVRAVVAHESPWHVTRHRPTVRQVTALSKMGWLASRGRHEEAAEAFLRFAYTYRDGGSAWDRFPDEWRHAVSENARAALADIRIAIGGYPSGRQLATVRRPVVCSCGQRSAETMIRVTRALAGAIPAAAFTQVPGAGHAAPFDAPSHFAKVVLDALALTDVSRTAPEDRMPGAFGLADGEPFAIDIEGEQHRPGPSRSSAVHIGDGLGIVAATAGLLSTTASIHGPVQPRPHPSASRSPLRHERAFGLRSAKMASPRRGRGGPATGPWRKAERTGIV